MTYSEDELLPVSALADITFCERRAALHQVERVWQENVATAEGHILHDKVHDGGAETRRDLHIARGLHIRSLELGLTGMTDAVEFARDENGIELPDLKGRWQPFPIEYKRGTMRHEVSFEVQLCAQAICLEEMLSCCIPAGALFYGLSRRRVDVEFTDELRDQTRKAAVKLHALVRAGKTPQAIADKKCKRCSLFDICQPTSVGSGKSAKEYLKRVLEV